ncbi:hypothetical protein LZ198_05925 [Myxococcus sp. K15C18031901]|uniref:fibrinogen-like YCDxxxxGGGW domain-containing protein n=1 Tax=Myxococcus dinghuensis TaxID=2906761 RepID=UPI0020A74DA2|nr:fibrinogen-like YCDxxxxGGGW domain-containing protein [Myxococcus dinghuensis]MCP3098413.1 hypothetical protein [Myxococcus dinghuensis]
MTTKSSPASLSCAVALLVVLTASPAAAGEPGYGETPDLAMQSCQHLFAAGVRRSGLYYLKPDGTQAITAYCEQETQGGGWALVYNSVLGINTLDFWGILYGDRLGRRGRPSLDSNFYDGSLYVYRKTEFVSAVQYMDVIEDLAGKTVVAFTAQVGGFNTTTMRFLSPQLLTGSESLYAHNFAAGWSAPDYDGDTYVSGNCATRYGLVTQHYGSCWVYSLGADAESPLDDGRVGPHLYKTIITELQLATDGTNHSRVRRISRFVRW